MIKRPKLTTLAQFYQAYIRVPLITGMWNDCYHSYIHSFVRSFILPLTRNTSTVHRNTLKILHKKLR